MKENNVIPKVSVIIACYNDVNITTAVNSAFAQTYNNIEIIVVDDGSNIRTKKVIAGVKDKIDILIEQENRGQGAARNHGISRANGEFILNLDSDDFFEANFCEKAIRKFMEDMQVKIVTCKARRFDKDGDIDVFTPKGGHLNHFLFSNAALGSSMFRKKDWETCEGYDEDRSILGFEDWEFYIKLLKDGGYAYVIPEVLFHYHVRLDSTTNRIKYVKQEKFKEIILKHSDLYIQNFDLLLHELFRRIEYSELQKQKFSNSPDFLAGKFILKPLRLVKSFFNWPE